MNIRPRFYKLLDDHSVCECDLDTWARTQPVGVAATEMTFHIVSTVFVGLDHNFLDDGPPVLFETMVFETGPGMVDVDCSHYSTWEQAHTGHFALVNKWREHGRAGIAVADTQLNAVTHR